MAKDRLYHERDQMLTVAFKLSAESLPCGTEGYLSLSPPGGEGE